MDVLQLAQYAKNCQAFKEGLGILNKEHLEFTLLGQGEYNINYEFKQGNQDRKFVLRLNTASQMGLEKQITYEYKALTLLKESGRTPKVYYLDDSKKFLPYGILVMEYLPGRPLNYKKDLALAAACLADIHKVNVPEKNHLIAPKRPLRAMTRECVAMSTVYLESPLAKSDTKVIIKRLLSKIEKIVDLNEHSTIKRCLINTELNSGNFLINGNNQPNYLIDWEKPLYGEAAQDLGHFLAPTTTFWKTDTILSELEREKFLEEYLNHTSGSEEKALKERVNTYIAMTCLRGITWCAMAWVQYQNPEKTIRNESAYQKICQYLVPEFLEMIESEYLNL